MTRHVFAGIGVRVVSSAAAFALAGAILAGIAACAALWSLGIDGAGIARTALWMGGGAALAAVLAVAITLLFTRRELVQPLLEATRLLSDLRQGNFGHRLELSRNDEIGSLAAEIDELSHNLEHEVVVAFERLSAGDLTFHANGVIREGLEKTNTRLTELLYELRLAGEQIALGSSQIANANQAQSQGATEQASAIEEVSTAIAEIAAQTKLNASHAEQASELATNARNEAQRGNGQMSGMVEAMREINAGSREISKIIKVIDDIAFQTNLLSLNAAVEAGRAGKHGRGFAVVADEVRKLAAKSAQAAKETAELIELSVQKAQTGAQLAESTAAAFDGITDSIAKASDLVGEIAAASKEQAQGIAQISLGLNEIDKVTQANSANTEDSAAAAAELASQAAQMKTMLSQFRLRHDGGPAEAGQAPLPRGGNGHAAAPEPHAKPGNGAERASVRRNARAAVKEWPELDAHGQTVGASSGPSLNQQEFGKY